MISLGDRRPAWRRLAGAQQRRLPVRHKRLAEIIDLAKNLDDPTSSPPSLSDGRLPQKAFHLQPVNRAKTPYPGCPTILPSSNSCTTPDAGAKPCSELSWPPCCPPPRNPIRANLKR